MGDLGTFAAGGATQRSGGWLRAAQDLLHLLEARHFTYVIVGRPVYGGGSSDATVTGHNRHCAAKHGTISSPCRNESHLSPHVTGHNSRKKLQGSPRMFGEHMSKSTGSETSAECESHDRSKAVSRGRSGEV